MSEKVTTKKRNKKFEWIEFPNLVFDHISGFSQTVGNFISSIYKKFGCILEGSRKPNKSSYFRITPFISFLMTSPSILCFEPFLKNLILNVHGLETFFFNLFRKHTRDRIFCFRPPLMITSFVILDSKRLLDSLTFN